MSNTAPKFRLNDEAQAHLLNMLSVYRPAGPNRHFSMMAIQLGYEGLTNQRPSPDVVWNYFRALYNLEFFDRNTRLPYLSANEEFSLAANDQFKGLVDSAEKTNGNIDKTNDNNSESNMDSEDYSSVSGTSTPVSVVSNMQPQQSKNYKRQRKSLSSSSNEVTAQSTLAQTEHSNTESLIAEDDDGESFGHNAGESILIKSGSKRNRTSEKYNKKKTSKKTRGSRQSEPAVKIESVPATVVTPTTNPSSKKKVKTEEKLATPVVTPVASSSKYRVRGSVRGTQSQPVRKNLRESRNPQVFPRLSVVEPTSASHKKKSAKK